MVDDTSLIKLLEMEGDSSRFTAFTLNQSNFYESNFLQIEAVCFINNLPVRMEPERNGPGYPDNG
ncbi:hypothetical protein GCM10027190_11920 [Spirosoma areae]